MPKFLVHARVTVPCFGTLEVEAESEEDAKAKALALPSEGSDIWESRLWQDVDWTRNIQWEDAEGLEITDAFVDPMLEELNEPSNTTDA